jgi:hypothetical protein
MKEEDKYIFLKLAEELNELASEILKAVNKPNKNNIKKINSEMFDVDKYLKEVKKILN